MVNSIEIMNLTQYHGKKEVLSDVTFTAPTGNVTAFLGPNGAGKSSTLQILLGLDKTNSGSAVFDGQRYSELKYPLQTVGAVFDGIGGNKSRSVYS